MKIGTRAAVYGAAGLALAGIVVLSGVTFGLLSLNSTGTLSILLTDPPSVPDGVSAVYISYSDVAVHVTGLGDAGWVNVPGQGTINTLGLVNLSQTISSGEIPSLRYNLVRFNVTSASVEFQGKNYSATIDSGRFVIPIAGGLKVDTARTSAALVDIQPTVVNLGNSTDPNFAIATGAKALQMPSSEVNEQFRVLGHRAALNNRTWFQAFQANQSETLAISGIHLSSNSLSFTAVNHGNTTATLRLVVLTRVSLGQRPNSALDSIPNSFVFLLKSDGSAQLLNGAPGQILSNMADSGYKLASGASQKFTYSGSITTLLTHQDVSIGFAYFIVVFGSQASSIQTVVAA